MAKANKKNWLRAKGSAAGSKVTFLELFFDLVFVFSISQLSHALAAHYTPLGAVEAALMTFAVWWVWIFTAWVTNWLDPDKMPVRGMLVALMMLGLVLSASIPELGDKGLLFAGAYVAMQVGRSLFATYAMTRVDRANTLNFVRITAWLMVAAVFWIAGGLMEHEARLIAWVIALVIEYAGPARVLPCRGSAARRRATGTYPVRIWPSAARSSSSSALVKQSSFPAAPFPSCRSPV